jgi:hypothetical protein
MQSFNALHPWSDVNDIGVKMMLTTVVIGNESELTEVCTCHRYWSALRILSIRRLQLPTEFTWPAPALYEPPPPPGISAVSRMYVVNAAAAAAVAAATSATGVRALTLAAATTAKSTVTACSPDATAIRAAGATCQRSLATLGNSSTGTIGRSHR